MVVIDPQADYIGLWTCNNIRSSRDFSIFYLWARDGFCIDNTGKAKILDFSIDNEKVNFRKIYDKDSAAGFLEEIEYTGKISIEVMMRKQEDGGIKITHEPGENYTGTWKRGADTGLFILDSGKDRTKIERELLKCHEKYLNNHIRETRNQHPFLALKEINFPDLN